MAKAIVKERGGGRFTVSKGSKVVGVFSQREQAERVAARENAPKIKGKMV